MGEKNVSDGKTGVGGPGLVGSQQRAQPRYHEKNPGGRGVRSQWGQGRENSSALEGLPILEVTNTS